MSLEILSKIYLLENEKNSITPEEKNLLLHIASHHLHFGAPLPIFDICLVKLTGYGFAELKEIQYSLRENDWVGWEAVERVQGRWPKIYLINFEKIEYELEVPDVVWC